MIKVEIIIFVVVQHKRKDVAGQQEQQQQQQKKRKTSFYCRVNSLILFNRVDIFILLVVRHPLAVHAHIQAEYLQGPKDRDRLILNTVYARTSNTVLFM